MCLFDESNAIVVQMADSVHVKDTKFTGFEKALNYLGTLKEKKYAQHFAKSI